MTFWEMLKELSPEDRRTLRRMLALFLLVLFFALALSVAPVGAEMFYRISETELTELRNLSRTLAESQRTSAEKSASSAQRLEMLQRDLNLSKSELTTLRKESEALRNQCGELRKLSTAQTQTISELRQSLREFEREAQSKFQTETSLRKAAENSARKYKSQRNKLIVAVSAVFALLVAAAIFALRNKFANIFKNLKI